MNPVEPLTQDEINSALRVAYTLKRIRASMTPPEPPKPEPEPECFHGFDEDEELRDRYQDRTWTESLADAVRGLSAGELLALAGIDPHTFGRE